MTTIQHATMTRTTATVHDFLPTLQASVGSPVNAAPATVSQRARTWVAGAQDAAYASTQKVLRSALKRGAAAAPSDVDSVRDDGIAICGSMCCGLGGTLGCLAASVPLIVVGAINIANAVDDGTSTTAGIIELVLGVTVAPTVGALIGGALGGCCGAATGAVIDS